MWGAVERRPNGKNSQKIKQIAQNLVFLNNIKLKIFINKDI